MQFQNVSLEGVKLHGGILGMLDPSLDCPDTESSLNRAGTEDGQCTKLSSTFQNTTLLDMLNATDADPLFVSPSNQKPSDNIAPYLSVVFSNVPERAKQNNILLTTKEVHCLEYYVTQFEHYCADYDVTIVVDGGELIEEEIRRTIIKLGLKEQNVHLVGGSCVILMNQLPHELAANELYKRVTQLTEFLYWQPMAESWGETVIEIAPGLVCDFFDRFPQWNPSHDPEKARKMVDKTKRPDASSAPPYSSSIYKAFGMTPAPTLAIESANSDEFRKLFYDCIIWIVGALLQLNAVIGINNSRDTYSVDILNFDLTVDRMMELARKLEGEQYASTRDALYQVAKMKASIHVLQLKLLDYLLSHPELRAKKVTQQDIDNINRYLQGDVVLAQLLCPSLKIRPLELSRFPKINFRELQPFLNDIKAELRYYKKSLTELHDCQVHMRPEEAILQCAHALVFHAIPMTFGPVSKEFILPQGAKVEIPIRALAGIGNGYVDFSSDHLENYLCKLSLEQDIEEQTLKYTPILLEWINDPNGLAADRGIAVEKMSPAKYNSNETLDGKIKFRYLTDKALHHIVLKELGLKDIHSREYAIWMLLRNQVKQATKKPLLKIANRPNKIQEELGYPWHWAEYGRVPNLSLPSSFHRKGPMYPANRGIHTTALPLLTRRVFYPNWCPRRVCRTLWTTIGRLPRH
uniref:ARAD1B03586p n=1 Tax=Blastobotrys adeninivorans TaxID=409370 RepID=A0A060T4H6_BLAAD